MLRAQSPTAAAAITPAPQATSSDAPPKQVSTAMERLSRASRLIADVRIAADHVLEALLVASNAPHDPSRIIQMMAQEESNISHHFQDLRNLGRQLEESGVLNGALKARGNSWGLHMPVVCPDGAVVAYAWKRQLAGQAGASAVDRTRLALKAFADQKRQFFPHLENESDGQECEEGTHVAKKHCTSQKWDMVHMDKFREHKTLSDIFTYLEQQAPDVIVFTYQRLDWQKRALSLPSVDSKYSISGQMGSGSSSASANQAAVIEILVPSVFRAVISLHPAGSISPDAVAFFSPDEGGKYIHARGSSTYHVFKHVTEYANNALQYFLSVNPEIALSLLMHWVYSYQTLFSTVCCKCKRLLAMEKSLALLLPPVRRPYQYAGKLSGNHEASSSVKGLSQDQTLAYHISCSLDEIS